MTTTATALADVLGRRKGRGDRRLLRRNPILSGARAVVFFGGRVDLPWLRFLKPDFRHCFVCVRWRNGWILIDPLSHVLEVGLIDGMAVDELQTFYENAGYVGVRTRLGEMASGPFPWRPYTCVEVVKRVVGLSAWWLVTPYQLYNFLKKENKS